MGSDPQNSREPDLTRIQRERNLWVARNFPGDELVNSILGMAEEVGELTHHYLKMKQGIRGDEAHHRAEMLDAAADSIIFSLGVFSHLGADAGVVLQETWDRVRQRDWVGDPTKGGE